MTSGIPADRLQAPNEICREIRHGARHLLSWAQSTRTDLLTRILESIFTSNHGGYEICLQEWFSRTQREEQERNSKCAGGQSHDHVNLLTLMLTSADRFLHTMQYSHALQINLSDVGNRYTSLPAYYLINPQSRHLFPFVDAVLQFQLKNGTTRNKETRVAEKTSCGNIGLRLLLELLCGTDLKNLFLAKLRQKPGFLVRGNETGDETTAFMLWECVYAHLKDVLFAQLREPELSRVKEVLPVVEACASQCNGPLFSHPEARIPLQESKYDDLFMVIVALFARHHSAESEPWALVEVLIWLTYRFILSRASTNILEQSNALNKTGTSKQLPSALPPPESWIIAMFNDCMSLPVRDLPAGRANEDLVTFLHSATQLLDLLVHSVAPLETSSSSLDLRVQLLEELSANVDGVCKRVQQDACCLLQDKRSVSAVLCDDTVHPDFKRRIKGLIAFDIFPVVDLIARICRWIACNLQTTSASLQDASILHTSVPSLISGHKQTQAFSPVQREPRGRASAQFPPSTSSARKRVASSCARTTDSSANGADLRSSSVAQDTHRPSYAETILKRDEAKADIRDKGFRLIRGLVKLSEIVCKKDVGMVKLCANDLLEQLLMSCLVGCGDRLPLFARDAENWPVRGATRMCPLLTRRELGRRREAATRALLSEPDGGRAYKELFDLPWQDYNHESDPLFWTFIERSIDNLWQLQSSTNKRIFISRIMGRCARCSHEISHAVLLTLTKLALDDARLNVLQTIPNPLSLVFCSVEHDPSESALQRVLKEAHTCVRTLQFLYDTFSLSFKENDLYGPERRQRWSTRHRPDEDWMGRIDRDLDARREGSSERLDKQSRGGTMTGRPYSMVMPDDESMLCFLRISMEALKNLCEMEKTLGSLYSVVRRREPDDVAANPVQFAQKEMDKALLSVIDLIDRGVLPAIINVLLSQGGKRGNQHPRASRLKSRLLVLCCEVGVIAETFKKQLVRDKCDAETDGQSSVASDHHNVGGYETLDDVSYSKSTDDWGSSAGTSYGDEQGLEVSTQNSKAAREDDEEDDGLDDLIDVHMSENFTSFKTATLPRDTSEFIKHLFWDSRIQCSEII